MPLGAGACPAGSSSAGYGVPDSAPAPITTMLPDPTTGQSLTGRAIDPTTKSYIFTPDGRIQGLQTVPQLVQLALTTTLGSSCLSTLGQTFLAIKEKGDNYQQQVSNAITQALSALVNAKQVQVIAISVQQPPSNPDGAIAQVSWVDLTTGLESTTSVGP